MLSAIFVNFAVGNFAFGIARRILPDPEHRIPAFKPAEVFKAEVAK